MPKIIQKIKAWRFPCESKPFYFKNGYLEMVSNIEPAKTKNDLDGDFCFCGKKHLPERIEIIVQRRAQYDRRE